jgi:hypothetical protein
MLFLIKKIIVSIPLPNISLLKQCGFFTLFLFISINLYSFLSEFVNSFFYELIYNGIFAMVFGISFFLASLFLNFIKKSVLNENILKKDFLSCCIHRIIVVFIFFMVTALLFMLVISFVSKFIPSFNSFQERHYLEEKFILGTIVFLNLFLILYFIRSVIKEDNFKIEFKSIVPEVLAEKAAPVYLSNKFSIYGLNKGEVVHMDSNDFIFAKSDGHYIKIYYFVKRTNTGRKSVRSILIRNSMKSMFLDVFVSIKHIDRVHKSYAINYNYIKSVRNLPYNKGGILTMNFVNINIPIGFTRINKVNTYLLLNKLDVPIYN